MLRTIQEIISEAGKGNTPRLAVAAAGDPVVLNSVLKAAEAGLIKPILIGDQVRIEQNLSEFTDGFQGEIINADSEQMSARLAVEMIASGQADLPMKGNLSTRLILKALLDAKYGLRNSRLLSLVTLIHLQRENRLIIITDGGMNIAPGLGEKAEIIENAVEVARALGYDRPRVAVLAAVEKVNQAMPATVDAAVLTQMAHRGQIKNCVIDGPLALDNALLPAAARQKGIESPVAGQADILLVPDIEAGNILYKSLVLYAGLESASLVYGARVPLVITSRADSADTKYNSIALASLIAGSTRK